MKTSSIFCVLTLLVIATTFGQITPSEIISHRGWTTEACEEADTVWVATTGGLLKYLKDGTLINAYFTTDGMLHNTVSAIAVDSLGNKWIGSRDGGITKFDGSSFTNYDMAVGNGREVFTIVTSKNSVWVGTWANGAYLYSDNRWVNYRKSNSGLINDYVHSIAVDTDGSVWFGTQGGISHYSWDTWQSFTDVPGIIYSIAIDEENNKWFAHWNGFSKFKEGVWTHYTKSDFPDLESGDILTMAYSRDTIWLGTFGNGVRYITGLSVGNYNSVNSLLTPGRVQNIIIGSQGEKYFSTGDLYTEGGISILKDNSWNIIIPESPIPPSFVMSLHRGRDSALWVGTYGGGLARFDGQDWNTFSTINCNLTDNTIYQIKSGRNNEVWFASNSGIAKFSSGAWENTGTDQNAPQGRVYDIEFDKENNLWAATDNGLFCYDGETWTSFNTNNSGIISNSLYNVAVDSLNNIWVGSFDNGLSKYNRNTWTSFNESTGLSSFQYIYAIEIDPDSSIWVAVPAKGVYNYNGSEWVNYSTLNSDMHQDFILSIGFGDGSSKWFGSVDGDKGGGISVLQNNQWQHIDISSSDLISNSVNTLLSERNDLMWAGTNFGISKIEYKFDQSEDSVPGKMPISLPYPNPTNGSITVDLSQLNESIRLFEIVDLRGNTIQSFRSAEKITTIDIPGLVQGVYILKITNIRGQVVSISRFLKL